MTSMIKNYLQSLKHLNNGNNTAKKYQNLMFIQTIRTLNISQQQKFSINNKFIGWSS